MKIGVIIIFRNNEPCIRVDDVVSDIRLLEDIKFCFVDNYSKDNTLQLMYEIKEDCTDKVEIVEIKKKVSESMAKRAGARYLSCNYNLKYVGFINLESLQKEGKSLNSILEQVVKNDNFIKEIKTKIDKGNPKQNFLKGIFSIVDSIKEINKKHKPLKPSI